MDFSKINELKPYDLNCNIFDVYSYDGLSMQELLCQFFTKINECIKTSNETIDLAEWLVNEGLKQETVLKLTEWLNDGTLENLINVTLFENLNKKIDDVSSQLDQKVNKDILSYVNVKDYGAIGDGITDDTKAIQNAINSIECGTVFIPYGNYLITNINVKKGITLQMGEGVFSYGLCDLSKDTNDKNLIDYCFIKNDCSDYAITCEGRLENIRLNCNRKNGSGVNMSGTFNRLYITRSLVNAIEFTGTGGCYEQKGLYVTGNLGNGVVYSKNSSSDRRLYDFNIWSNRGHGIVFKGGNGTINFSNGKIEWSGKNNIEIEGYTNELSFDDCIIDAANWYNIHIGVNGMVENCKFNNCNIIGGRRDLKILYGEVIEEMSYSNKPLSMMLFENAILEIKFNGCFFRKINALHDAGVNEQIEYIFGGNSLTLDKPFELIACSCKDFPMSNLFTGISIYKHTITGTIFKDSLAFTGGVNRGEILIPTVYSDTHLESINKNGSIFYDGTKKRIGVNEQGKKYFFKGNFLNSIPTTGTSTGSKGDWSCDANYLYICVADGHWRRCKIDIF